MPKNAPAPCLWLFLLLLCSAACNRPGLRPAPAQDAARITAISAERARAFEEGNARGIARHFAADAWLMPPGGPAVQGPEAVAAYYQGIFDAYATRLESGYHEGLTDGDLAYGRGFARVTLISKTTGDTTFSTAKYLNVLRRQAGGDWQTIHDIWNSDE